jgi:hypothetical protein
MLYYYLIIMVVGLILISANMLISACFVSTCYPNYKLKDNIQNQFC